MNSLKLKLEKGALFGYSTKLKSIDRRKILFNIIISEKATYKEIINRLNILRIFNRNKDNDIWKIVSSDMDHLRKIFRPMSTSRPLKTHKKPLANSKKEQKTCPPGKVRNPDTGRCKKITLPKKCSPGKVRNPETGKCIKIILPPCPPGKVRNPETGRCIKIKLKLTKSSKY